MVTLNSKKGFTIIELIVVMSVIGILVLLAIPKFMGYTEKAKLTEIKSNTKQVENAAERYYMDKQDWPRLTDVPYTVAQITSFAQEVTNKTGQVVTLDATGSYYDVDYAKLQQYVQKPKNDIHYIIQNPVGEIYYLNNLTTLGETRLTIPEVQNNKPVAVITMTPNQVLTTDTNITWSYISSTDSDGDSITNAEWKIDGIIKANPNGVLSIGTHIIELNVQDSKGLWSSVTSKTIAIEASVNIVIWDISTKGSIATISNNSLTANSPNMNNAVKSTISKKTGKWYYEMRIDSDSVTTCGNVGVVDSSININSVNLYTSNNQRSYGDMSRKFPGYISYGSNIMNNDIIGIALDMDNKTLGFYKNGVYQGIAFSDLGLFSEVTPYMESNGSNHPYKVTANFGATPFAYNIPVGFNAYNIK